MQEVFRAIGRLSRSSLSVLVTGESGTGKELVARALHRHSPRANGPFIALNTSAIASELLESELFGHEKGAFTGADAMRRGRFEQADGGTLFLDEIGDMSLALQVRLLRVLAEGEFYRVGGSTPLRVDVRVIAATHQDLDALVQAGQFREDLLHRLNVIRIRVPSLRERPGDIPELLGHYLALAARELARRAEDARRRGAQPPRRLRMARQRAPARERGAPPHGDRAGPRDPRRGHPAGPRRGGLAADARTTGAASSRPGRRGTSRAAGRRCWTSPPSASNGRSRSPRSNACRDGGRKRRSSSAGAGIR